ncbi:MAG: efflux RND transporter periplasmic adaptor subunit [bacterium]|nr:efflux RND transporter periplasmic adaptor subunit [bacterium]
MLIVAILVVWYRFGNTQATTPRYVLTAVSKGTVIATVSSSGEVAANNQVDVQPQTSGKVVSILVKQGQDVKVGDVIAILDQRSTVASLRQAQASYESAKANQLKVQSGLSGSDLVSAQTTLQAAKLALDNAEKNIETVTTQQDTAVSNAYTSYLNTGLSAAASIGNRSSSALALSGAYAGSEEGLYKITLYETAGGTRCQVSGLETGDQAVVASMIISLGTRGLYLQFPANLYGGDSWTVDIPNGRASGYLSAKTSYQNTITSRTTAITNAQNSLASQRLTYQQAEANFTSKVAPPSAADSASAAAQVTSALAALQNAQNNYSNTVIKAPFGGTIAKLSIQLGADVGASTAVATLVTKELYAKVPLNEVDVAKIALGKKATLTFDAVEDLTISGTVASIDTLGTVSQGVVNYNVNISFDTQDARVKPSMSTTAAIMIDAKQDVLTLPNAAVKSQGTTRYVEVLDAAFLKSVDGSQQMESSKAPTRVLVTTGLASDSLTEILSGLKEGDQVVSQTVQSTAAKATTGSGGNQIRIPGISGGGQMGR